MFGSSGRIEPARFLIDFNDSYVILSLKFQFVVGAVSRFQGSVTFFVFSFNRIGRACFSIQANNFDIQRVYLRMEINIVQLTGASALVGTCVGLLLQSAVEIVAKAWQESEVQCTVRQFVLHMYQNAARMRNSGQIDK